MSNEDFSDVVFLFTARRTGGTALAHAFESSGFHLFFDPLNQGLADLEAAKRGTSDGWLSKHPKGFNYFRNFETISQNSIPQDLGKLNSEWLKNASADYERVRSYFQELIMVGRKSLKPVCFKVEEINIYEMLKFEFATAKFVGLLRDRESVFDSYANQALAANNYSFFQSDWLTHAKHKLLGGQPEINHDSIKPSIESLIDSFEWVSEKHAELVTALCDFKLEIVNGEKMDSIYSEGEKDSRLASALQTFRNSQPELKFGLDTAKILTNFFTLVAERDGLVAERDGLVAERDGLVAERDGLVAERDGLLNSLSWRSMAPFRRLGKGFVK